MAYHNMWADFNIGGGLDGNKSNRRRDDGEERRGSAGYQRLLGDMDDMYSDSMTSSARSRADQVKQERVRAWKELAKRYPTVDEEILYSTFKTMNFDTYKTEGALREMGIKPGMDNLDSSTPPRSPAARSPAPARSPGTQRRQETSPEEEEAKILDSIVGSELLRMYPAVDRSVLASVLVQSNKDFTKATDALKAMGFERGGAPASPRPVPPPPQAQAYAAPQQPSDPFGGFDPFGPAQPAQSFGSPFGAPASNPFDAPAAATASPFGAPTSSPFGAPTSSPFGAPTSTPTYNDPFGYGSAAAAHNPFASAAPSAGAAAHNPFADRPVSPQPQYGLPGGYQAPSPMSGRAGAPGAAPAFPAAPQFGSQPQRQQQPAPLQKPPSDLISFD